MSNQDNPTTEPQFVVLRKAELDYLIHQLDLIHFALDLMLEAQDARRDLAECLPYDCAQQLFLNRQHLPQKGGAR